LTGTLLWTTLTALLLETHQLDLISKAREKKKRKGEKKKKEKKKKGKKG